MKKKKAINSFSMMRIFVRLKNYTKVNDMRPLEEVLILPGILTEKTKK